MPDQVSTFAFLKDFFIGLGYTKVYRTEPSNLTTAVPLMVIRRIGGAHDVVVMDRPRVDIDWYASTEDTAEAGALRVKTLMLTRLRGHMFGGAVAGVVRATAGPALLPWDASGAVFRCGATYEFISHQYSGVS